MEESVMIGSINDLENHLQEINEDHLSYEMDKKEFLQSSFPRAKTENEAFNKLENELPVKILNDERGNPRNFEPIPEIEKIDINRAEEIINNQEPKGSFYVKEGKDIVAIDNTKGEAIVEEFQDLEESIDWLEEESEREIKEIEEDTKQMSDSMNQVQKELEKFTDDKTIQIGDTVEVNHSGDKFKGEIMDITPSDQIKVKNFETGKEIEFENGSHEINKIQSNYPNLSSQDQLKKVQQIKDNSIKHDWDTIEVSNAIKDNENIMKIEVKSKNKPIKKKMFIDEKGKKLEKNLPEDKGFEQVHEFQITDKTKKRVIDDKLDLAEELKNHKSKLQNKAKKLGDNEMDLDKIKAQITEIDDKLNELDVDILKDKSKQLFKKMNKNKSITQGR